MPAPSSYMGEGVNYMSKNILNSFNVTNVTDEKSQILAWISPLESWRRHRDISAARVGDVGDWVLKTTEFQKWLDDDSGGSDKRVLLGCGIPGVGKTFICSLVVDNLCDSTTLEKIGVACLYCDYGGKEEQTPASMIGSLLRQFVTGMPEIPEGLTKAFEAAKGQLGGRALKVEKMIDIFPKVLESFDRAFICIDALDEFKVENLAMFLQLLKKIIDKSPNTRLFLTGRVHIRQWLEKQLNMSIITINVQPRQDDIKQYLTKRLDNDFEDNAMDDQLKEEIITIITRNDSEIFLLVTLHIDAILGEITIGRRREKLYQIGNDLSDAYGATIERIKGQSGERSRSGMAALMWISLAERPLSIAELCHALAVEVETTDLDPKKIPKIESVLGCCLGLVTVDQETSTVRPIHATLQEYLQSQPDIFGNPHATIAEICLSYLNLQSIKELSPPQPGSSGVNAPEEDDVLWFLECALGRIPFLEYASCYWGRHAQKGLTDSVKRSAIEILRQYPENVAAVIYLKKMDFFWYWEWDLAGFSGLHYVACIGVHELVEVLLERGNYDVNQKDSSGCTPLNLAARSGHEKVVEMLVIRASVNPNLADNHGRTPISWAVRNGLDGVVKLLLDRADVDLDLADNHGITPLSWAAKRGHEGVLEILLRRADIDPNSADRYGRTPLFWAVEHMNEGVAKILLNRVDINPDLADEKGRTPFSWAAEHGYEGVVDILLDRADVNLVLADNNGRTPLSWAAMFGHESIVKSLLRRTSAHLNSYSADSECQTVFHLAAKSGHHGVVRLLLEWPDLDPNALDIYLRTPLSWAAGNGHLEVIQELLNWADVNPDSVDSIGRTPLSWAAGAGHEEVVTFILNHCHVCADSVDIDGRTPLFWVAGKGDEGTVGLLLNREDVNPDRPDNTGRTVFSWAAGNGKKGVVEMLLEYTDVFPDLPDCPGRTPLSWAAGNGYKEVVELLLTRNDVYPEYVDNEGRPPLCWALVRGHEGVAVVLQERADGVAG